MFTVQRWGRKKEEDDKREVAAEKSIIPLNFNGNYEFAPDVVFVSKNACLYIISVFFLVKIVG